MGYTTALPFLLSSTESHGTNMVPLKTMHKQKNFEFDEEKAPTLCADGQVIFSAVE